ncbi:MAG: hypothetical protein WCB46_05685 [Methanoregula sp.]
MITLDFSRKGIQAGIIVLIILPAIITALYIIRFGVNVIFWDQWGFFGTTLAHWYEGTLSFQDLFHQTNENRMFFPKILMIGIASVTSYNTIAEMACSFILLLINLALLYTICSTGKKWSWEYLVFFIPVVWLFLSIHQWENLLMGFQISFFLCVTGVLIAISFLERCNGIDWNLGLGIVGGVLSSFSAMFGLMIWPTGLALLLLKERRNPREISGWLIAAIVTILIFFNGWVRSENKPSLFYVLSKPVEATGFFFALTANSFGFNMSVIGEYPAILVGILFFFILGFTLYRAYGIGIIRANAGIIALIVFALLSEVMVTAGRGGFGIIQTTTSRYVTFTVFGIIGTYLLFINLKEFCCKDDLWLKRVFCLFCILILAGIIIGMGEGLVLGEKTRVQRQEMREILISYPTASDSSLKMLHPDQQLVRKWAPVLKKYQLNVFAGNYTTPLHST